jgi:hypothetical protein
VVIRALLIAVVISLLALPALSARGQREPAVAAAALDREATAYAICSEHGGVHETTPRLITCWDGALHRWDGSHVRRRVPVLHH